MTHRILLMAVAAILFLGSATMAQEKKDSPASPSDISVDQIKKATGAKDATKPAATQEKAKPATTQEAKPAATDAKKTDAAKEAPKPVMEGTAVAQPDCQEKSDCSSCDSCKRRCRGRIMGRLRGMFGRRCCG